MIKRAVWCSQISARGRKSVDCEAHIDRKSARYTSAEVQLHSRRRPCRGTGDEA